MSLEIRGTYELPDSPVLVQELAGTLWDVRIGGVTGVCHMPVLKASGMPPNARRGDLDDYTLAAPDSFPFVNSVTKWGDVASARPDDSSTMNGRRYTWRLAALHFHFHIGSAAEDLGEGCRVADEIETDVARWFATLADWLVACSDQYVDFEQPSGVKDLNSGLRLFAAIDAQWKSVSETGAILEIGNLMKRPCPVSIWRHSIAAASRGEELPLAWRLLVNGRRALMHGRFRIAVLEAGLAVEIALREALARRLSGTDPVVAGLLINRPETLGRLTETCKTLGLLFPDLSRLTKLRNDAVHRGVEMHLDEAHDMLRTAETALKALTRLPTFDAL